MSKNKLDHTLTIQFDANVKFLSIYKNTKFITISTSNYVFRRSVRTSGFNSRNIREDKLNEK